MVEQKSNFFNGRHNQRHFSEGSLSLGEGYRIFAGGILNIEDVKLNDGGRGRRGFRGSDYLMIILLVLRKERINEGGYYSISVSASHSNLFFCTVKYSIFDSLSGPPYTVSCQPNNSK